jgi:GT2 family glycosyltransferase
MTAMLLDVPTLTASVVVCTYAERRWPQLVALLAALDVQDRRPAEVVLVVDHAPALLARAKRAFPHVHVVANTQAQGLSGARNCGVAVATGDVVVFIDDDARPRPDFLSTLLAGYADGRVVGVGGRALPEWESGRPAWFPPAFDWVVGCSHEGLPERTSDVRNMIGAAMSFRRDSLQTSQLFDPSLGRTSTGAAGCEETELCLRLTASAPGSRIRYVPTAQVDHLVPSDRASLRYFVRRCWAEGTSKARVARLAGAAQATGVERTYVRSVLPRALGRSVADLARFRFGAALCGPVILLGLGTTVFGYLLGRVRT